MIHGKAAVHYEGLQKLNSKDLKTVFQLCFTDTDTALCLELYTPLNSLAKSIYIRVQLLSASSFLFFLDFPAAILPTTFREAIDMSNQSTWTCVHLLFPLAGDSQMNKT